MLASLLSVLLMQAAAAAEPPRAVVAAAAPVVDPASVVFFPDEGRLELKGQHLAGVRLRWPAPPTAAAGATSAAGAPAAKGGEDVCLAPKPAGGASEQCTFTLPRTLPGDAALVLLGAAPAAAGASSSAAPGPGAAAETTLPVRPARIVVDRLLPSAASVDLTSGVGRLPLVHPEAVASVDCAPARCELTESAIQVRAISGAAAGLTVRMRLAPHVVARRGDELDAVVSATIAVLHCSLNIASGLPLRRAELSRIVVRMDDRCGRGARDLRWTVNGEPAELQRVEKDGDGVYVQLGVGDIEDAQVAVMATRPEPDGSVVAVARTPTREAPQPRASLELPGIGRIDFIPTNRDALVHPGTAGDHAHLVTLPIEDVYHVAAGPGGSGTVIRGETGAGGLVALRFGYRVDSLPASLAATDLAVLTDPVQRPLREASVPAPLGTSSTGPSPLLELLCGDGHGEPRRILPGKQASIPYAQRDSCRLVIHRERLSVEQGTQDIAVDVAVTKVDDGARPDAHVTERMVLRPGKEPRVFWLHGIAAPFDRFTVRVSHIIDEAHDVGGSDLHVNLPSAQWAVVVGTGHLRFYATAAIPTGLFRITAPSDVLTLNFGALSRLTWLTADGQEGLLGLELGAMGIGLAATPGFPRTLAVLGGLGLGVPIGNRGETSQASVNLHAWVAYELRNEYPRDPANISGPAASHWSFLFGPSITFGNVGTNL